MRTGAKQLRFIIQLPVLVLLIGTVGFMILEDLSFVDAFYFTIVTISTVGYGDKVPITPMGRVIGVILMFTGIGIIGVLSGTIASYLLKGFRGERETEDVEEALRILKIRRAKGEVSEETYLEIRKDLEDMFKEKG